MKDLQDKLLSLKKKKASYRTVYRTILTFVTERGKYSIFLYYINSGRLPKKI